MGRLGGCADLNLGAPARPPRLNPLGDRSASPAPDPDRSSVKDVMKCGGVNVNPAWSKLPVEEDMAIDATEGAGRLLDIETETWERGVIDW